MHWNEVRSFFEYDESVRRHLHTVHCWDIWGFDEHTKRITQTRLSDSRISTFQ